MKIAVFTSNQPRHTALIESLAKIADEVFAVRECTTIFPGKVQDFFSKSPIMQDYFSRMIDAEREIFGPPRFTPKNVRTLSIRMGDLPMIEPQILADVLNCDHIVVFGSSYIRGELCERLVEKKALNIHMGVSPQYRGSSTNFWAMFDGRPQFVGATIHLLTAGLDSGPMLFHALPAVKGYEPFALGMTAVRAAHLGLVQHLRDGTLLKLEPVPQDRSRELRYTRNADFTDEVAQKYLANLPPKDAIHQALAKRSSADFLRPFIVEP